MIKSLAGFIVNKKCAYSFQLLLRALSMTSLPTV